MPMAQGFCAILPTKPLPPGVSVARVAFRPRPLKNRGFPADPAGYMIWFTTPPSTRMAAPEVPEAAWLQR